MRQKSITLIIWLMALALIGVMAMQYFYLRQSYTQKSLLFDESVKAALNTVASKAEKKEVLEYSKVVQERNSARAERERNLTERVRIQEEIESARKILTAKQVAFRTQQENLLTNYPHAVYIDNSFFETYINTPANNQYVRVDFGIQHSGIFGNMIQDNFIEIKSTKSLPMIAAKDDSVRFLLLMDINPYTQQSFNNIVALPPRTDPKLETRVRVLEQELRLLQANNFIDTLAILGGKNQSLLEDFVIGFELSKKPLNQRIDLNFIEEELSHELRGRDISAHFGLEVRDREEVLFSMSNFGESSGPVSFDRERGGVYSVPLFREDLEKSGAVLTLIFPDKQSELVDNLQAPTALSIALLLVIVGCFAYTILTIIKQKKVSEMKTDFINNMTHEFKTPVATIMIASESLKDPEINSDQARIERLAGIIYDENVRLGNHIERVLNIAKLDKENLHLVKEPVDINSLVENVTDSMHLQFQKYGAELQMELNAKQSDLLGDELHLSNVIYNLLDNALKYSQDNPVVKVSTANINRGLLIKVEDNGIGMNKDQQSKIFERFYRIHTGNLHDVKGFGLGLSYVADIVRRMKGTIHVKSEKGKGSIFEVFLPIKSA